MIEVGTEVGTREARKHVTNGVAGSSGKWRPTYMRSQQLAYHTMQRKARQLEAGAILALTKSANI